MIWLVWRQHRKAALFTLLGLAALAAFMIPTGLQMHRVFDRDLAACVKAAGTGLLAPPDADCQDAGSNFGDRFRTYEIVAGLLMFLPLLVGLFWGAPLVARELEQGTHRMVWTQDVSRTRWAVAKIGLVLGFVAVVSAAYTALVTWWLRPLAITTGGTFQFPSFDLASAVPVAYTLFAVALGVVAGVFVRKVLPAMAVVLIGFLAARTAVTTLGRPRFLPPAEFSYPFAARSRVNDTAGTWIQAEALRDAQDRAVVGPVPAHCAPATGDGQCADGAGLHNWIQYQPAGRYWPFQLVEAGIFVALAALLVLLAIRRLRRTA